MAVSPVLGEFNLTARVAERAPGAGESGRRAETLVKHERLRVVLVTMRPGAELQEHTAPGPITIQTLQGSFVVEVDGTAHPLDAGMFIAIDAHVKHAVRAHADGAFLLTISWPPHNPGEPATVREPPF